MPVRPATAPRPQHLTDKQVCQYIAEMCLGLVQLAERPRLRTIRYLLDMARLESERTDKDLPG